MANLKEILSNYLRPYQRRFISDQSNRIIVNKARQIGFSEVGIIKGLIECVATSHRDVYLASTSLRDSKELVRRLTKWIKIFASKNPAYAKCKVKKESIEFPNGSRLMAVPAHAVRGKTGTIILDEVAFLKNCRELWGDISPAAESNPNLKLILISTPFGKRGIFHDIWTNSSGQFSKWSRHEVDVYTAAKEGFPVDPVELKKEYPSDIFAQEFCCKFGTDENQYFSHELLMSATVDDDLTEHDLLTTGIDLASVTDASVMVPLKRKGNMRVLGSPHVIKPAGEDMHYSDQEEIVFKRLNSRPYDRIATDGTGEGKALSQNTSREYGKIVKVWDSGTWRASSQTVMDMKRDLEDGSLRLLDSKELLRAFTKVKKRERSDKTIKFETTRDSHGHGDEFSASLMAYDASQKKKKTAKPRAVSNKRRHKISF